ASAGKDRNETGGTVAANGAQMGRLRERCIDGHPSRRLESGKTVRVKLLEQPTILTIFTLSTPFHKYDHICGEGFLAQTRRERRAYPSAVCKERATTSGPKGTAARRGASLFGSGFVAPRSQPHCGGCSLVASRQTRKSTQQTCTY